MMTRNRDKTVKAGGLALVTAIAIAASGSFVGANAAVKGSHRAAQRKTSSKVRVTKEMVAEAQRRLLALGYWIGDADGKWGEASRHGLIAFQKVEGRPRTGKLSADELKALKNARPPAPRERGFAHVEVDLSRQVLFVIESDGTVSKILPVSTGSGKPFTMKDGYTQPAVTPPGRFRVYRKVPGWRKSELGLMYYPSYIVGGIAIHGNPAVPAVAASHGCIRIPMFAAEEFSNLTDIGTQVLVYDAPNPTAQHSATRR